MTATEENRTISEKQYIQDCAIAFKQKYPLPYQVHLTVTPPRYAVNGSIHKASNYDATGDTPYFPDRHSKINQWVNSYILLPLRNYLRWDNPGCRLYGLTVIVPTYQDQPQHAHCLLCCDTADIAAATINTALQQLDINRHRANNDDEFSYTSTTVLAEDINPNTGAYVLTDNYYHKDVVSTLRHYNQKYFPTF